MSVKGQTLAQSLGLCRIGGRSPGNVDAANDVAHSIIISLPGIALVEPVLYVLYCCCTCTLLYCLGTLLECGPSGPAFIQVLFKVRLPPIQSSLPFLLAPRARLTSGTAQ